MTDAFEIRLISPLYAPKSGCSLITDHRSLSLPGIARGRGTSSNPFQRFSFQNSCPGIVARRRISFHLSVDDFPPHPYSPNIEHPISLPNPMLCPIDIVLNENPVPIRERMPGLEKTLAVTIDKALLRNPKARFPDAGKMLASVPLG